MRTFFDFDAKLRNSKINGILPEFKRYSSLSALPFDYSELSTGNISDAQIRHYREMITKQLISKFAVPQLTRAPHGQLINCDEALEGIPECFRHTRPVRSVLKIGVNVSAQAEVTKEIAAMRCAAVLAIWQLAKSRGQKVQFDVCYGYCGEWTSGKLGHSRVTVPTMTIPALKRILGTLEFRDKMINEIGKPFAGGYQLWYIEKALKAVGKEFDFVLDRLEENDSEGEYQRILKQIEHLR